MNLMWFRRDLRTKDNPALNAACEKGEPVIAVFVETPSQWESHHMAPVQADLIRRRLEVLRRDLSSLNIPLLVEREDTYSGSIDKVASLARHYGAETVFANREYELNEINRDKEAETKLENAGIHFSVTHDRCLQPPKSIVNGKNEPYKVFTPFKKAWLSRLTTLNLSPTKAPQPVEKHRTTSELIDRLGSNVTFSYPTEDSQNWPVEDEDIINKLRQFCHESAEDYNALRDFPAVDGTSRLSPYLAIGALSARQCFARLQLSHPTLFEEGEGGASVWLSELVWRDFYQDVSANNPHISKQQPFLEWGNEIKWQNDVSLFEKWKQGQTGYPIVDAAMRQLNETGWMHNRLRMIVASFLTKDLLIDWRWGENYFMSRLIDGDFASNNGGWQWSASVGTDAQPYFRIFNPTTQGQRFDPKGDFVRIWVKELENVPSKHLHTPHLWAEKQGVLLDYAAPIVDHAQARKEALAVFEQAKSTAGRG